MRYWQISEDMKHQFHWQSDKRIVSPRDQAGECLSVFELQGIYELLEPAQVCEPGDHTLLYQQRAYSECRSSRSAAWSSSRMLVFMSIAV